MKGNDSYLFISIPLKENMTLQIVYNLLKIDNPEKIFLNYYV